MSSSADPIRGQAADGAGGLGAAARERPLLETVAPLVRAQLARWERRAEAIRRSVAADAGARASCARSASTSRSRRRWRRWRRARTARRAMEAIVALQVMYDYLDLLTEQPLPDQLRRSAAGASLPMRSTWSSSPARTSDPRGPQARRCVAWTSRSPPAASPQERGVGYYRHGPRSRRRRLPAKSWCRR